MSLLFWGFSLRPSPSLAETKDRSYVWPVEKTRGLSSTFAEHRNFRFHSGIDVPTEKKIGFEVYACQSGYVYRLFTSWRGYGKAVYLKLDDGRLAVYGHLSDFSEEISKVVTKKQLEAKRYKTDFLLQENEMRVEKAELVGYSGESGWGGPHLHFELRDSSGHPVNPLTSGFSVKDGLPPTMKYLAIRPLGVGARVDGSTGPLIFSLIYDSSTKAYALRKPPLVDGEIGLELSVYDRMETSPFSFGIYRLELFLDDSLLFSSRYDEFSFESTHKVELDRDFELRKEQGRMFHKLFVEVGNDLPIYDPAGGRIKTEIFLPGPHKVEIKVFDVAGNLSTLAFYLIFDESPSILSCSVGKEMGEQMIHVQFEDSDDEVQEILVQKSGLKHTSWEEIKREKISGSGGEHTFPLTENPGEPALLRIEIRDSLGASSEPEYLCANLGDLDRSNGGDSLELDFTYTFKDNFFIFNLGFNQMLREAPQFSLGSGGFDFDPLFSERLDEKSYRLTFPFFLSQQRELSLLIEGVNLFGDKIRLVKNILIAIITKSFGGEGISPDGGAKVEFDPDVAYHDLNVIIQAEEMEFEPKHRPVGKAYAFEPSTVPLNGWAGVSIQYPEAGCDPHRLGLYELMGDRSWRFVGQELDSLNRTVGGKVRHLSVFALLEDILPPEVSQVSISTGTRTKVRRPKITVRVKDDLSGIGSDEDVLIEIDGEWMIPEYDPEKHILSTRPVSPLTLGGHLLFISVKDRAGNETKTEREFYVVGK
jgi:hypothetical protein